VLRLTTSHVRLVKVDRLIGIHIAASYLPYLGQIVLIQIDDGVCLVLACLPNMQLEITVLRYCYLWCVAFAIITFIVRGVRKLSHPTGKEQLARN